MHERSSKYCMQTFTLSFRPIVMLCLLNFFGVASVPAQVFRDVPPDHWASMEAEWLKSRGILEGWDGKLHGEKSFNRYQAVEVLYRVLRQMDAQQASVEERLASLEAADRRIEARVDTLFETAQNQGLKTPPKMADYQARRSRWKTGSRGTNRNQDAAVVERLRDLHQRVAHVREEGVESPVLVIPPGSVANVALPEVLMDGRPASFKEGVHVLHWGARIQVPVGSSASLLMPQDKGGLVLLERTSGVLRKRGFLTDKGSPRPLRVDAAS